MDLILSILCFNFSNQIRLFVECSYLKLKFVRRLKKAIFHQLMKVQFVWVFPHFCFQKPMVLKVLIFPNIFTYLFSSTSKAFLRCFLIEVMFLLSISITTHYIKLKFITLSNTPIMLELDFNQAENYGLQLFFHEK